MCLQAVWPHQAKLRTFPFLGLSRHFMEGHSRMQEKSRLRQTVGTHQVSHTHTAWPGLCSLLALSRGPSTPFSPCPPHSHPLLGT